MVPVNGMEALERACEALLRRREEKMALSPIKLVQELLFKTCQVNTTRMLSGPPSNLTHGHDTRANRTRHTTSSSTQPHANDANQRTTPDHPQHGGRRAAIAMDGGMVDTACY